MNHDINGQASDFFNSLLRHGPALPAKAGLVTGERIIAVVISGSMNSKMQC